MNCSLSVQILGAISEQKCWTETDIDREINRLRIPFYSYAIVGSFLLLTNTPIVAAILFQQYLRSKKEYIIIGGLAFADALNGFTTLLAAIYRLPLLDSGEYASLTSRWYCLLQPFTFCFIYLHPLVPTMLLVVSLERLLMMRFPLKFIKWPVSYAWALLGAIFVWITIGNLINLATLFPYMGTIEVEKVCITAEVYTKPFYLYTSTIRFLFPLFSCAAYVLVYFESKNRFAKMSASCFDPHQKKKQMKLTFLMGISTVVTGVLVVIPMFTLKILEYAGEIGGITYRDVDVPFYAIGSFNGVCNFFIYTIKSAEMKQAVKLLFRCKQMNPNADYNNTNNNRV